MLGADTKVAPAACSRSRDAVKAAEGTALELFDCAFPLLAGDRHLRRPQAGVRRRRTSRCSIGARPRSKGMERADLLEANGAIFKPQGEALNAGAADDIKVLVVGNPANTNALIAARQRARHPGRALHRDDAPGREPRGRAARAEARRRRRGHPGPRRVGQPLADDVPRPVQREGRTARRAVDKVDMDWYENEYIPRVGKRGAEIIEARGASSAASAANAAIDHVRDWVPRRRRPALDGRPVRPAPTASRRACIVLAARCRCSGGELRRSSEGLEVGDFAQGKIDTTVNELNEERDAVKELGLV